MLNSGNIVRINGNINTVNDSVIGGLAGITGVSKFAGQLGQVYQADDQNLFYASSMGTVYGGAFQYVRLAAGATAVVVGQIVFWDLTVAQNLYQVTTLESGTTPGAQFRAGIVLNSGWSAGYYSFVQVLGPTFVKFRAALTGTAAVGVPVYAAAAGVGADNGFADVIGSADPADFSDVNLMQQRYLGTAMQLPTAGGLKLVDLAWQNVRS